MANGYPTSINNEPVMRALSSPTDNIVRAQPYPYMPRIQPESPTGLPSFNPGPGNPLPPPGEFRAPITTPDFNAITERLSAPVKIADLPTLNAPGMAGNALFERGVTASASRGIRPETQRVLDILAERSKEAERRASSEAIALAGRRGLPGSSIEQFGVQTGIGEARKGFESQEANVLLENARQNEAAQTLANTAMFERANALEQLTSSQEIARLQAEANKGNQEAALELERRLSEANFYSQEIASQRNIDLQLQSMRAQQILGEQGLAMTAENIRMAEEMARRESRDSLVGNLISTFGPGLLFGSKAMPFAGMTGGAGGAGGGGLMGGFGGIMSPVTGALQSGIGGLAGMFGGAGGTMTGVATGQFVPGVGMVGTGAPATAMGGGITGMSLLGGAALGLGAGLAGTRAAKHVWGSSKGQATGSGIGGVAGGAIGMAFGGPLGAGLGAGIGSFVGGGIGKAVSSVSKSIKKVFPF